MEAIEECTDETWAERERFWIAHFRSVGIPLTNLDSGGNSGKCQSEETKAKIRAANTGRKCSPEQIAKIKASKKANLTPEVRERIRLGQLGKKQSAETKDKRASKLRGRAVSEETRNKLSMKRLTNSSQLNLLRVNHAKWLDSKKQNQFSAN